MAQAPDAEAPQELAVPLASEPTEDPSPADPD
jgi:hypothetical protein